MPGRFIKLLKGTGMKTQRQRKTVSDSEQLSAPKKVRGSKAKSPLSPDGQSPLVTYEYAPIGIVECSLDGNHLRANEEFCRLLGYERGDFIGKGIKSITHEDDYPIDIKLHQQLVEGKIPYYRLEKRYIRKDGEILWVELTRSVVRDAAGKPLYTVGVVLDISDRKHVERVLRDSSERLRLATETARMFMWELDLKSRVYTFADNFEQVLGFAGGLLPKNNVETFERLSTPEDMQMFWEAVDKAIASRGDLHSLQIRLINPENGQTVWLEVNAKIVYNADGNPKRMFGLAQNITQNKRAEELERIAAANLLAMAETNAKFQTFFEQGSYFAGVINPDGTLVEANRLSLDFCGFKREDVIGKKFWDCGWWNPSPALREMIRRAIAEAASGKPFHQESAYFVADGSQRVVDLIIAPVKDESGQVLFLAPTGIDITERKQAEEQLRQQAEILEWAYILIRDLDSRIISWNKGVEQLYGWTKEEALGKVSHDLFQTRFPVSQEDTWEKLFANGEWEGDLEHIRRDGTPLIVHSHQVLHRDADGKPVAILEDNTDITERRRIERQQEALYQLTDELQRTTSLEDVFESSLNAIMAALQCDRASILLFDDQKVMSFVAWRGLSEEYRNATNGHSPWTPDAVNPVPISMNDVSTADLSDSLRATIQGEGIGALAFIPLVSNERLIGKFMTYYNAPHVFSESEVELSLTIAHQLAFAVDRKRIERELEHERELLQRLFETMPVMVSIYDAETRSLRLNGEFTRSLGWRSEEVSVLSLLESLYPDPDYRTQVLQRMAAADGTNEWVEVQVQKRDGHKLDSLWSNISISKDKQLVTGIALGIDITERKRSEEKLRQAAVFDEAVMNNMGEGLYTVDSEGRVVSMNPAAEKIFGWTLDELRGRRMHDVTHYQHPDGTPFPAEECAGFQVLHHGRKLVGYEDVFIRKDGTFFDVVYSSAPLWENGKISGLVVVFNDNTIRKQSERRLVLLSGISELVRRLDDPNELLFGVSKAVGEHLRVRRCLFNEIDVDHDIEIVHRDYCNGVESVAGIHKISDYSSVTSKEMEAGKTVVNHDSKLDPRTAPDYERAYVQYGERAYVTVPLMRENRWVASLWVSDDKPRAWSKEEVSLLETIAERTWLAVEKLRINRALYDSEEQLRVTFETAVVGFATLTLDTRFIEVNDAFCRIVGYSREELLQMDCSVLTHADYLESTYNEVAQLIDGNTPSFELEKIYIRKDGTKIWVQNSVSVVRTADDQPLHLIAICQDITERKQAEQLLRESEQRFREIFETAGVSVWLEDFTQVKSTIDGLRAQGIGDFRTYFTEHPDFVREAIDLVQILNVNNETLDLFGARNKQELLGSLSNVFAPETEQIFIEELTALAEGRETLRAETQVRALDGKPISVLFTVHFASPTGDQSHVVVTLTDITERKRAEEALRIENQRFMRFVDSNIVGIIIANPSGKVLLANDYYLRLLGVTRQDFEEEKVDWRKFTPPEWLPADEKAIRELRESGVCEPYEKEYIRTDGSRVPVYLADAMLPGPGEEIAAFVLDLTERKKAEESLRASETLYRTIARSIPGGGVYVVDKDMRYLVADGAVTESFGLSREMLEGHTVSEVFRDQQRARMIERLNRNFAGEIVSYETEHNGRIYWTQQAPLFDSLGQAIIVTLDITERKHAEEALRQSEERFAQFMEHLPGLAWIKDRQGRYVYANVTAEKAFNIPRETLYGRTDYDIFPPDIANQFKRNDEQALLNGKGIQVVETLQQNDGILHYSLVSKFPIPGPDGQVELIGGTAVDITERKQAEEALQLLNLQLETRVVERTAALQNANSELLENRKRLQFLSQRLVEVQEEERRAIARELHDRVGQTLSALNINLIIMRGQILPDSLERVGPRFNDSMQLVGETITLVRDVMSNLRPAVLDDYGLEAALQSHMDEFTARYGIKVTFDRPAQPIPRLGPSIEMTFLRIAQEALINIARHANATQVTLSLWQEGSSVCMTIQDNGSGIESWQEANRPGSHGLTIMRERAEAFGGNLKVGSAPGQGTKVEMSIPMGKDSQNEVKKEMWE